MSFLGAKGSPIPRYTSLTWQTASSSIPVPILYGRQLISPNIIWMNGFGSYNAGSQGGGGGKGGGSSSQNWDYHDGFMFGICEGPVKNLWENSCVGIMYNNGSLTGIYTNVINGYCFPGTWPQSIWTDNNYNSQMLNYPGICYLATNFFNLGTSNTPPSLNIEIYGLLDPSTVNNIQFIQTLNVNGSGNGDIDPATIVYDFLTNGQYGVLFPAQYLDQNSLFSPVASGASVPNLNDSSYQTYCYAQYLAMSPLLQSQETANSILARWMQITNTACVWSGGKLKFIPFADAPISATNAYSSLSSSWNPPQYSGGAIVPYYYLTDDDYVHDGEDDPVICKRTDPYSLNNWLYVEYLARNSGSITYFNSSVPTVVSQEYQAMPVGAFDQNFINQYGLRMGSTVTAHEFCDIAVAQISAQLMLQRQLYIRNTYTFKLSCEYCLLEPMDVIAISDTLLFGAGVYINVRIMTIEEDDEGILSIEAEEYPGNTTIASHYNQQTITVTTQINRSIVPQQINQPIIFEPPATLTNNVPQVWASVSASIPPVQLLTQNSSTSLHQAAWLGEPATTADIAAFSIQVAMPTSNSVVAVSLSGSDGAHTTVVDFLLSSSQAIQNTGFSTANSFSISTNVYGGITYYTLTIIINITVNCTPLFALCLTNGTSSPLTISFTGNGTGGIYYWQPQTTTQLANSATPITTQLTDIPSSVVPTLTGASLSPQVNVPTPLGTAGLADPNWGGCYVFASIDGVNFSNIGTITAPARMGSVLSTGTSMPAVNGLDTTSTLAIDLSESGGAISLISNPSSATTASTLCIAMPSGGGVYELFAYGTSILNPGATDSYQFKLSYFERGLYGTTPQSITSTDVFARLDSNTFIYNLPSQYTGVTLYFKFQSFNIYGGGLQDISECVKYTYVPTGDGAVGNVLQALAIGTSIDLGLVSSSVSEDDDCGSIAGTSISYDIVLGNI